MNQPLPSGPLPSPCISVCALDEATGLCTGCLRTLDEIAAWSIFDNDEKRGVWSRIAARRARMSPPGRPKGEYRSAQREGDPSSPPGRPKGEYRSAQHEGDPINPPGRPKGDDER